MSLKYRPLMLSRTDSTSFGNKIWAFKASASPLINIQVQVQVQVAYQAQCYNWLALVFSTHMRGLIVRRALHARSLTVICRIRPSRIAASTPDAYSSLRHILHQSVSFAKKNDKHILSLVNTACVYSVCWNTAWDQRQVLVRSVSVKFMADVNYV